MILVADTHALVWFLEGSPRLSAKARSALLSADAEIVISAIVLAEIAFLFRRNRIEVDLQSVLTHISQSKNCSIYPVDKIVVERLPADLNIHDGLIAATALVFRDLLKKEVALVTKDQEIIESGIIRTIW